MAGDPLVSFIVLSYNYEHFIRITLESIFRQTFQDFEVVVVDDASADASCEVVRSFHDPRVRLHINDHNMGGARSYNLAVSLARGAFLASVDADDWIEPRKTELQLGKFESEPELDIIGTHIKAVDEEGQPHSRAPEIEESTNRAHNFNLVDSWVVQNNLCRSSTLIRRSVHERIGLDEPLMVRAPDYELWTRALHKGLRFGLLPEQLTNLRAHAGGVTHRDPGGAFREICYILLKNIFPLSEERATYDTLARAIEWVISHDEFALLRPSQRYRLLAMLLSGPPVADFGEFQRLVSDSSGEPELSRTGRRCLALARASPAQAQVEKLRRDVEAYIEARDFFRRQTENWEREAISQRQRAENLEREAVSQRQRAENWEREAIHLRQRSPGHWMRLAKHRFVGFLRKAKRLLTGKRP